MFDIGGWEFFLILLLALIIIGPKDLPVAIRTVTQWIRRARGLAREFQSGLEDIAADADLDKLKNDLAADTGLEDIRNEIHGSVKDYVDPDGDLADAYDEYEQLGNDDPFDLDPLPDPDNSLTEKNKAEGKKNEEPDRTASAEPSRKPESA